MLGGLYATSHAVNGDPYTANETGYALRYNRLIGGVEGSTRAFCKASNCAGVRSFLLVGRSDGLVSCDEGWSLSAMGGL